MIESNNNLPIVEVNRLVYDENFANVQESKRYSDSLHFAEQFMDS